MSDASPPLALITGGHRRLGGAIAARLAHAGYALALHGSHDAEPEPELRTVLHDTQAQWHGLVADFAQAQAVSELMEAVIGQFGRAPDLLVNSAACFGQDALASATADTLHHHYAVNCVAPVLLTRALAAQPHGQGRCVVNILDQRLFQPHGDQLSYTLSKQALAGFTQIAARTLAPHVRVNAVAPGLTIPTGDYSAEQMERMAGLMPLSCLSLPDDIARAVLYLAQARAVTGQVICVDAGAHMHSYPRDFMHL